MGPAPGRPRQPTIILVSSLSPTFSGSSFPRIERDGSGIPPQSITLTIRHQRPGRADDAARILARQDVAWHVATDCSVLPGRPRPGYRKEGSFRPDEPWQDP